jgi:hypothetical protein
MPADGTSLPVHPARISARPLRQLRIQDTVCFHGYGSGGPAVALGEAGSILVFVVAAYSRLGMGLLTARDK